MNNTSSFKKAFTLLETLVSVGILALMIVGPLAVITGSSSYAKQTKDGIIAMYLAEEGIELVKNQYDSLYVLCKKQPENPECTPIGGETSGEVSWRVFKTKFSGVNGQSSCYKSIGGVEVTGAKSCSYDYASMIVNNGGQANAPIEGGSCSSLTGYRFSDGTTKYLCTGSLRATGAVSSTTKTYKRSIFFEQLPTYETGAMLSQYNDDIKLISEVEYKGVNGVTYKAKVNRLIHAQP